MKRASSSGKKSQAGDFKRLKAKVGKRAPKQLNATDTKFRTATVQVQSQSISNEHGRADKGKQIMISSKGKHFTKLMGQLNHPAANARSSALQGMKDAIINTPADIIPQHLSLIIPSLSQCIVDEDSSVRKSTMAILFKEVSTRMESCQMGDRMRPFLPLILAYIGSALHSLDQDVRYDGCVALETLCNHYHDLFMEGGDEILKLQATIPAFVILLDDVSGGLASMSRRGVGSLGLAEKDKQKSKNRQKQSKMSIRGVGVLKSFIAVTKITTSFYNGYDILAEDSQADLDEVNCVARHDRKALLPSISRSDLEFLPGGKTSNAIVWKKNDVHHPTVRRLSNIQNLRRDGHESIDTQKSKSSLDFKALYALFTKLRDRFVEVTQTFQPAENGIYLSPTHALECALVVNALRLLWNGYTRKLISDESGKGQDTDDDATWKKLKHTATSTLNSFLECFAIKDTSGNRNNCQLFDSLNASLCMALSEFGSVLANNSSQNEEAGRQSMWVKAIFSYVLPQLDKGYSDSDTESPSAISNTRSTLVKVVEQLLLQPDKKGANPSPCLLDKQEYMELLTKFGGTYFSEKDMNSSLCKSIEGRSAAALLVSLVNLNLGSADGYYTDKTRSILIRMASLFPVYLMKWRGSFPRDTAVVLATLLAIARKCVEEDNADEYSSKRDSSFVDFLNDLRDSLQNLFFTSNKLRKISTSEFKAKISVFEEISKAGQTVLVSLIGVLRFPSDKLTSALAQICARRYSITRELTIYPRGASILSDDIIDYIMGIAHSMNRTMSLQQYLTFLMNSSGIHSAADWYVSQDPDSETIDRAGFEFICSYDQAISRMCKYTLLTKTEKTVSMLKPVIKSWLEPAVDTEGVAVKTLKARAAISILSCHALTYQSGGPIAESSILCDEDLRRCALKAVLTTLQSIQLKYEDADDNAEMEERRRRLTSPFLVRFSIFDQDAIIAVHLSNSSFLALGIFPVFAIDTF